MKDEIKEIIESLGKIAKAEYYPEDLLTYKECQLLLDYITNLQEENERLKDDLYSANQVVNELLDVNERNEKEIEYMKERKKYKSEPFYLDEIQTEIVFDILQGEDKE